MAGWYRAEADWWPKILAMLPRPLEREAVLHDLRWLSNEVEAGRAKSIPGRRILITRWGWSERLTRNIVENVALWSDPHNVPQMSQLRPTNVPDVSRLHTEEPAQVTEIVPTMSQKSPNSVPQMSHPIEIDSDQGLFSTPNNKQRTINNKQEIDIDIEEIHALWVKRFQKLRAPTIEGIAKSYKVLKKDGIIKMIDWLSSDHPRARLIRGETGEENRLHSATPWRPTHRTEYFSFAEEVAEAAANPQPSLIPSPLAGPKQTPTNDIAPLVKKIMAIPDHLHQGYRPAVDALGPLAPELKALGGGTWGSLQERLASQYTRRATEQAIRELLEKQ